jgi:hypothetical protein
MLKKTTLVGLACAIALTAPAFGQSFPRIAWAPHAALGGAIGGYAILGATVHDNAPLWALNINRFAHVTGNFTDAVAKFDRVIQPDGSVVLMRRISSPANPDVYAYLPRSWPPVGAIGKERIMDASGRMIAEREVIIPQFQILAAGIPTDGPRVATLAFERSLMPDGTMFVTASAQNPDPNIAIALLGNQPALREALRVSPSPTIAVASQ